MPLEKIVEKILSDARVQAQEIVSKAKAEADGVVKKAESKAQADKEKRIGKAKSDAEDAFKREVTLFNLEARKKRLNVKCNGIDVVFNEVVEAVNNLSVEEYKKLIGRFVPKAQFAVDSEIIARSADRDKVLACLADVVGSAASGWKFAESEDEEMLGGFFIRSGDVVYDISLNTIIEEVKTEVEKEVASILYG